MLTVHKNCSNNLKSQDPFLMKHDVVEEQSLEIQWSNAIIENIFLNYWFWMNLLTIAGFFFVHRSQNSVPKISAKLSFWAKTQFSKIQKLSFYDIFNFELWILIVKVQLKAFQSNEYKVFNKIWVIFPSKLS